MKKLYFSFLITLIAAGASSQNTYYWQAATGGNWATAANWTTQPDGGGSTRTVPANNDILVIDKQTVFTITAVPAQTIGKLSILSGSVTLTGSSGSQTLTIGNTTGTDLEVAEGATLVQDGSLEIMALANSASADISGTFQVSGEFSMTAGSTVTNVTGSLVNTGTIAGATTSKLLITGKFIHQLNGGTVPSATWNAGSTLELPGITSTYPSNMGQQFRNVVFNGNHSVNILMTGDLRCAENLTIQLSPISAGGLYLTNGNANRSAIVGGTFQMRSGTFSLDNNNGGSDLTISGGYDQTGGVLTETSTSAAEVYFAGAAAQSFSKTGGTISQNINFTINTNANVNFGTSILDGATGSFSLSNGAKIITAHAEGLHSTGAAGAIQVSGARTFSSTADYEFRGAATGTFSTTSNAVRNLVINNTTTGSVTAQRVFNVTGGLSLASGYFTTSAGQLSLGVAAFASTANGAFVNGPMSKATNSITTFTFPVGKVSGGLRTIGIITASGTASNFTAEFFRGVPPAGTLAPSLTQKSACEYWDLSRPSGAAAKVVLSWAPNSSCNGNTYVTQPSTLRVGHLTGGVWNDEGYFSSTGDASAGTVTSLNAVNSFSPFALASNSAEENPLPVVFADLKAFANENGVRIEWSNLTEKDVIEYKMERSSDGVHFDPVSVQQPTSNRSDRANYIAYDGISTAHLIFYRIKAIETGGKITYSPIITLNTVTPPNALRLYPNPVTGNQITLSITGAKPGSYNLTLINAEGQNVFSRALQVPASAFTQTVTLPSNLKTGIYQLLFSNSGTRQVQTILIP